MAKLACGDIVTAEKSVAPTHPVSSTCDVVRGPVLSRPEIHPMPVIA